MNLINKKENKIIECYNCKKELEVKKNTCKYVLCNDCKNIGIKIKIPDKYEKYKKTCLEKYGVENISQLEKIKNKKKMNSLKKFGVDNPLKNEHIKNKIIETNLLKYGYKNPNKSKEIKEKIKNTNNKKYGQECSVFIFRDDEKIRNKKIKNMNSKIKKELEKLNLDIIDKYELDNRKKIRFKCLVCDNIFISSWFNIQQWYRCPICYPKKNGISDMEKEISMFVKSLDLNIIENSREIIKPKELDIFIPEKNIAIEFHGLYWHCDKNVNKNYHLEKLKLCQEKNIRLIQIFEDEWLFKQDIVKSRLKQILNCHTSIKIHARKCLIHEIDNNSKNEFLDKYHIQGKDNCKIKLGAFFEGKLVAVMTFGSANISKGAKKYKGKQNVWELNRFCNNYNYHIPGIASKLLAYFKRNYKWKIIFSYADLRWSEGNVYYKLGFELEYQTKPNYYYFKEDLIRKHRYGLRKKPYEPKDKTEIQLRNEEGYYRIWDCGNIKYVMINENDIEKDEGIIFF